MSKISGPLLDRFDIHLEVPALSLDEMFQDSEPAERSTDIRQRVMKARQAQMERLAAFPRNGSMLSAAYSNAQMNSRQTRKFCSLDAPGKSLLRKAVEKLGLSARAHDRILKVARTIADLEGETAIHPRHISEAIQYRSLDRPKGLSR